MKGKKDSDLYYFDTEAADRAVSFFSKYLTLKSGESGMQPFQPQKWEQERIIRPLFGWKKKSTGYRRYNKLFLYVPRKNNKTTLAVGLLLAAFFLDDEPGGQIYNAANDENQSRLSFDLAKWMIEQNKILNKACTIISPSILRKKTFGIWRPLSKESKTKDGFDIHACCMDEIHEWQNRHLYDKLKTGSIARKQPLQVITTTAGTYDPTAIWMEVYNYCKKIKTGEVKNDTYLVVMFEPDDSTLETLDPFDEELWKAVNPGWGVTVDIDQFRAQAEEARGSAGSLNSFKRYHLNIITKSETAWIPHHVWAKGQVTEKRTLDQYAGRQCFLSVDLANYSDLLPVAMVFPNPDGVTVDVLMYYWVTFDKAQDRKTKNEADYFSWRDQGYCFITPGNVHDYQIIRKQIGDVAKTCRIQVVGYDEWNASQFAQDLGTDGINGNPWPPQNMKIWHKPTQKIEAMATAGQINHFNNPILAWNIENVLIREKDGYIKPDKGKSKDKIDGAIALIIAIGEWMNYIDQPPPTNGGIGL